MRGRLPLQWGTLGMPDSQEIEYIKGQLDLHIGSGFYSRILVEQLRFHVENRTAHIFAIMDEIAYLENKPLRRISRTKPPTQFTGDILRGLWHKHYTQAAFIEKNIQNHWRQNDLDELANSIMDNNTIPLDKRIGQLAHRIVIDGYKERSDQKKMTGEWIIYARQDECNYYLTLGHHDEDAAILERVLLCEGEFPALKFFKERAPMQP